MRKKLVSLFLAIVLLCAVAVPTFAASAQDFTDVSATQWFYGAVSFATSTGMVNGTSENTFSPGDTMTRSQFVAVLGRMDGVEDFSAQPTSPFTDINTTQYYAAHVNWAYANGITDVTTGAFRPHDKITREEMAIIVGRYVEYKGTTLPEDYTAPASFKDADSISATAASYAELLRHTGLVVGDDNGNFNPKNAMNRAEGVTVFMRIYQKLTNAGVTLVTGTNDHWFRPTQNYIMMNLDDKNTFELYDFVDASSRKIIEDNGYYLSLSTISDRSILGTNSGYLAPWEEGTVSITWLCNTYGPEGIIYTTATITIMPSEKYIYPTSITASAGATSIEVGQTTQLSVDFTPANTTRTNLEYQSSNSSVAYVTANGVVTAMSAGTTTITVISSVSTVRTTVDITVTPKTIVAPEPVEPPVIDDAFIAAFNAEIVRLVNELRAVSGLSATVYGPHLQSGADTRVNEMIQNFSHTRPDGTSSRTAFEGLVSDINKMTECGYLMWEATTAESVSQMTPEWCAARAVTWWSNSPAHKAILCYNSSGTIESAASIAFDWNSGGVYICYNAYQP